MAEELEYTEETMFNDVGDNKAAKVRDKICMAPINLIAKPIGLER